MQKLITPIQYEDSLDELNIVRPLKLDDEVKHNLDIPVLDVIPVSKDRPAKGKLLRCDNNGGMLVKNHAEYENYEKVDRPFIGEFEFEYAQFSQKVSGVLWECKTIYSVAYFWWSDPSYSILFQTLANPGETWIKFSGTRIYFVMIGVGDVVADCHVYGFYN